MLAFAIFAVSFVAFLIGAVIYLYPSSKKPSTIPGMDAVSEQDGNLGDVARAGSLHEFLMDLHEQFGPIASFWWGRAYTVSIASPDLFKEHQNVFDRPVDLFEVYQPLMGAQSIQFANSGEGRARRRLYDRAFTADAINKYFHPFQEVSNELVKKWDTLVKEEHIPLGHYMAMVALKAVLISLFGESMRDDKQIFEFQTLYDVVWSEMELRLKEPPTEASEKSLQQGRKKLHAMIQKVVDHRRKDPPQEGDERLIDLILEHSNDGEDADAALCDALTYVVAGFNTIANLLTWGLYFLATHPQYEAKVVAELKKKIGDKDVNHKNIGDLVYLRQVINETLRCAVITTYTARYQDFDSQLGGHKIPKNTPVIHALGVVSKDESIFPLPDNFDPDRFSSENSKSRSEFAFVPFGFAGKRACPGKEYAYAEATILMATILRKFKLKLVDGQVSEPVYGLVTHPSEEIWVTLSQR